METKLFIANLPFSIRELDLLEAFAEFGTVVSARIPIHRGERAGQSKGFGFVVMADGDQAAAAIKALHYSRWEGREVVVQISDDAAGDQRRFNGR